MSILLRTGGIEPGVLLASGSGLRGIAEMNVNGSFGVLLVMFSAFSVLYVAGLEGSQA